MKQQQQPDMIAQVGQMINSIAKGQWSNPFLEHQADGIRADESDGTQQLDMLRQDERAIVLASAMLAIAGELRAINNSLAQLVEDNVLIASEALPLDGDGGQ